MHNVMQKDSAFKLHHRLFLPSENKSPKAKLLAASTSSLLATTGGRSIIFQSHLKKK